MDGSQNKFAIQSCRAAELGSVILEGIGRTIVFAYSWNSVENNMRKMAPKKYKRAQSFPDVYSRVIDVLFLGAAKVGKTNLVRRLLDREFQDDYSPTVYDVFHKEIVNDNGKVTFQITDMSGFYSFPPMRRIAVSRSDVLVLVYEIGNEKSYKEIGRLKEEIEQQRAECPINIIVVGNKLDKATGGMMRDVDVEDSVTASAHALLRVSAKTGENILLLFKSIMEAGFNSTSNSLGVKRRTFTQGKSSKSFTKRISLLL